MPIKEIYGPAGSDLLTLKYMSRRQRFRRRVIRILLFLILVIGVLAATGQLQRVNRAIGRRISGVFNRNQIDLNAAKARLLQAGGADLRFPLQHPRLLVAKDQAQMSLYDGERLIKRYSVALGRSPLEDKSRKGDGRTPEGEFVICTHELPRGAEHLFIGLNFPRTFDADKALKAGIITQAQREAIAAAERTHGVPPWDTPLGGAVGIHGVGDKGPTSGCIGMTDEKTAEIFVATTLGTPVVIKKTLETDSETTSSTSITDAATTTTQPAIAAANPWDDLLQKMDNPQLPFIVHLELASSEVEQKYRSMGMIVSANSILALADLPNLLAAIYQVPKEQIVNSELLPSGNYLAMIKMPQGREREIEAMVGGILAANGGISVERQKRSVDAWLLTKDSDTTAGLHESPAGSKAASGFSGKTDIGGIHGQNVDIRTMADLLRQVLKKPVINKTGLGGKYDFTLRWEEGQPETLPEAIDAQLGLKLELKKTRLDVLVVRPVGEENQ